jgi:hypothetical protein
MSNPAHAAAARQILASMKELYGAPQTLQAADEKRFAHLKLADYGKFRDYMKQRGFRPLGDFEIPEVNRSRVALLAPTMIRALVSPTGDMAIAYYQTAPRVGRVVALLLKGLANLRLLDAPRAFRQNMRRRHLLDVMTEFDDGTFLTVSNAGLAAMITQPPSIERILLPDTQSPDVLLNAQARRLQQLAAAGGRKPFPIRSSEDLLRMHKRMSALKVAYRAEQNWVTRDELRAMSAGNEALADAIYAELEQLVAAERRQR